MSAIRLARAATGRKIIVKFEGCYRRPRRRLAGQGRLRRRHLWHSRLCGRCRKRSRTSPWLCPITISPQSRAAFAAHPGDIAAIIVEPIVGNAGCVPPAPGYLEGPPCAQRQKHGALLIVDEVMTGFRVALGGACELYRLDPDLVTLGKIVGGGLPVGVFGGKRALMDQLAPLGPVYQAGTLSGNPLAMAAGVATVGLLCKQHRAEVYPQLEKRSASLAKWRRECLPSARASRSP